MAFKSTSKLNFKLLIERKSQKLLFAEVHKDVVDFLFSLLSLPLGSVAKLVTEESGLTPLSNTYHSWEQLKSDFLLSIHMKSHYLIPDIDPTNISSFTRALSSANPSNITEKIYTCNCKQNVVYKLEDSDCRRCYDGSIKQLTFEGNGVTREQIEREGYVKVGFTCALMDDLSFVPSTTKALLNKMGHTDLSLLEEKSVSLDVQKGLELLMTSFKSKTVLSDMFLTKKKEDSAKEAN